MNTCSFNISSPIKYFTKLFLSWLWIVGLWTRYICLCTIIVLYSWPEMDYDRCTVYIWSAETLPDPNTKPIILVLIYYLLCRDCMLVLMLRSRVYFSRRCLGESHFLKPKFGFGLWCVSYNVTIRVKSAIKLLYGKFKVKFFKLWILWKIVGNWRKQMLPTFFFFFRQDWVLSLLIRLRIQPKMSTLQRCSTVCQYRWCIG